MTHSPARRNPNTQPSTIFRNIALLLVFAVPHLAFADPVCHPLESLSCFGITLFFIALFSLPFGSIVVIETVIFLARKKALLSRRKNLAIIVGAFAWGAASVFLSGLCLKLADGFIQWEFTFAILFVVLSGGFYVALVNWRLNKFRAETASAPRYTDHKG